MLPGQRLELRPPSGSESEVDLAVIGRASGPLDQADRLSALGELDRAVMADLQLPCRFADRGPLFARMAANDEQELVKRWREPSVAGRIFAPAGERA